MTSYHANGPVFTAQAKTVVDHAIHDMEETVADEAVRRIRQRLGSVLQHPTGRYASRVTKDMSSTDVSVTDGGVVYGPWLEGTSSRNDRTRFKGYATFRRIGQELASQADLLTHNDVAAMTRELNGGS